MTTTKTFPPRREGRLFLTDGGIETEIMYKRGFELPHFAMYPLLDNPGRGHRLALSERAQARAEAVTARSG